MKALGLVCLLFQLRAQATQSLPAFKLTKGKSASYLVGTSIDRINDIHLPAETVKLILAQPNKLSDTKIPVPESDLIETLGLRNQANTSEVIALKQYLGPKSEEWKFFLQLVNRLMIDKIGRERVIKLPFVGLPILSGLALIHLLPPYVALGLIHLSVGKNENKIIQVKQPVSEIASQVIGPVSGPFQFSKETKAILQRLQDRQNQSSLATVADHDWKNETLPEPIFLREIKDAFDILATPEAIKAVLRYLVDQKEKAVRLQHMKHIPFDVALDETLHRYELAIEAAQIKFAEQIAAVHSEGSSSFVSLIELETPHNPITLHLQELGFKIERMDPTGASDCDTILKN